MMLVVVLIAVIIEVWELLIQSDISRHLEKIYFLGDCKG